MPKAILSLLLLLATLTVAQFCTAQQSANPPLPADSPQPQSLHGAARPNPTANGLGEMPGVPAANDVQKQQAIAANLQRQVEIRRDAEKMLELTAELKDDLQNANHVLSVEAIRKAGQIEKLARSVKSKMKASF
jgi:hypothetical protein